MSNYPPGVTGFEDAIAGPDEREFEDERECDVCQLTAMVIIVELTWQHSVEEVWDCPNPDCLTHHEKDVTP